MISFEDIVIACKANVRDTTKSYMASYTILPSKSTIDAFHKELDQVIIIYSEWAIQQGCKQEEVNFHFDPIKTDALKLFNLNKT